MSDHFTAELPPPPPRPPSVTERLQQLLTPSRRPTLLRWGVVVLVAAGFLSCAWSGGWLGLWALICAFVAGYFFGTRSKGPL
jgi:hypothetical protein